MRYAAYLVRQFLRVHSTIVLFIILLMSIVLGVQMYLYAIAKESLIRSNPISSMTESSVGIYLGVANKKDVGLFLSSLASKKEEIAFVEITGFVKIVNPRNESADFRVATFFPGLEDSYYRIDKGTLPSITEKGIFLTCFAAADLEEFGFLHNNAVTFMDTGAFDVVGVGNLSIPGDYEGAVTEYEEFFSLSPVLESITIQLSEKPDQETYQSILNQASKYLDGAQVKEPYQFSEDSISAFYKELALYLVLILVCAINVMSLFGYLLSIWKRDFRIVRILGGRASLIWKSVLLLWLGIAALSAIIGFVIFQGWHVFLPDLPIFLNLGWSDYAVNIAFYSLFLLAACMIHTAIFVWRSNYTMTEDSSL